MSLNSFFLSYCNNIQYSDLFITFVLTAVFSWLVFNNFSNKRRGRNSFEERDDANDAIARERKNDISAPFLPLREPIPYTPEEYPDDKMVQTSADFFELMNKRRGVRSFKTDSVPIDAIKYAVMAAATSPSGNHTQPWSFVVVTDHHVKQAIRDIVEEEERVNYDRRMSKQWVVDLSPLGLTWKKEYLTVAPALLLVFRETHGLRENGEQLTHYFCDISIGMASGILQSALQAAGFASIPTAPLNVGPRIRCLLNRPSNEKLTLLFAVGKATDDCQVPDLRRKELEEFCVVI